MNWIGNYEFKVYHVPYMDSTDTGRMKQQGYLLVKEGIDVGTSDKKSFVFARLRKEF